MNNFNTKLSSLLFIMIITCGIMPAAAQSYEIEMSVIQDATVNSRHPEASFANIPDFIAMSWESNADTMIMRSLIEFDASEVPAGAIVEEAWISLYASEGSNNPVHFGENEARICRLASGWDADSVSWENQPLPSPESEVLLEKTTSPGEHFEHIEVTDLVQSILAEESGVIGLSLLLQSEDIYTSLNFASADHADSDLHPRLTVRILAPSSTGIEVHEIQQSVSLYPNPAISNATLEFNLEQAGEITVQFHNVMGQLLEVNVIGLISSGLQKIDFPVSHLPAGQVFATIILNGKPVSVTKFVRI
ncbi:MAG: hypothetical protein ACI959_001641 [Limisphaerales bacterium]|jgi:hypothetical protein